MKFPALPSALCIFSAVGLLFSACDTVNTVMPAQSGATPHMVADKRIITNSSLNDIAYVAAVRDGTASGNLKRIEVDLHNTTSAVKNVDYKFEWFDAQGLAITTPAAQTQTISIEGGDTRAIGDTATTPNAVDWKLTLLESSRRTPGPP